MKVIQVGKPMTFQSTCNICDTKLQYVIGEARWGDKISNDNIRAGVITCLNCLMPVDVKMDTVSNTQVLDKEVKK